MSASRRAIRSASARSSAADAVATALCRRAAIVAAPSVLRLDTARRLQRDLVSITKCMSEPTSTDQDQRKAREAANQEISQGGDASTHERVKEGQQRAIDAGLPEAPPEPKTV